MLNEEEGSQLLELKVVQDIFATGCGKVEILGSCARFWMYVDQEAPNGSAPDRVVVAKIMMPIECVPEALRISSAGISSQDPKTIMAKEMLIRLSKSSH